MKFFILLIGLLSVSAIAQQPKATPSGSGSASSSTGRVNLNEEAFNNQAERCKPDSNVTPSAGARTAPQNGKPTVIRN
jgi:hypothetical protein